MTGGTTVIVLFTAPWDSMDLSAARRTHATTAHKHVTAGAPMCAVSLVSTTQPLVVLTLASADDVIYMCIVIIFIIMILIIIIILMISTMS